MLLLVDSDTPSTWDSASLPSNQFHPNWSRDWTHPVFPSRDENIFTQVTNSVHWANDSSSSCGVEYWREDLLAHTILTYLRQIVLRGDLIEKHLEPPSL